MKQIEKLDFLDAPDFIQEQIYREIDEDETVERGDIVLDLIEFDPKNSKDLSILKDHLKSKISDEGEPDMSMVDEIGSDGYIKDPILI